MGREHLNFSNWHSLEKADKAEAFYEIADEVTSGEMPMKIYPLVHWEANLSEEERKVIANWAEAEAEKLYQ
jgi:hypothetical protein